MAGRPPKVEHVREAFLREITSAKALTSAVGRLPMVVNSSMASGLHPKHMLQIEELAFMGVVAAWEEFLEMTLVRYIAGARYPNGQGPSHKYGRADSLRHAYEIVSQDANYDPAKKYLKVNDPRWVLCTADFYFEQHSYTSIRSNMDNIRHANVIRNRIAHSSEKCRTEFRQTALHYLSPSNGKLRKGYAPGDLLHTPVVRHFSQQNIQAGTTHFEAYLGMYEMLAVVIVP